LADIIHRDLKPSNIMMTKHGVAKVLDFGIAKLGDAGLTKAGMIVGTPSYLSPEQAAGRRLDHRSDVFSLGTVFYELLTGERAFPGDSTTGIIYKVMNEDPVPPMAIEPTVPRGLDAAIRKAMAKDPDQRFQSCEELREAIRKCRVESVVVPDRKVVGQPSKSESGAARASDNRMGWIIGTMVAVAVIGALAVPLVHRSQPSTVVAAPPVVTSSPVAPTPHLEPASAVQAAPTSAPLTVEKASKKEPADDPEESPRSAKRKSKKTSVEDPDGGDSSNMDPGSGVFSRNDIPTLFAKADGYFGRGEYDRAIYIYQQILNLDHKNATAQDGMRRAKEAKASSN
jgi:serine/threonine protein kinase